jgi:hypothetical protein
MTLERITSGATAARFQHGPPLDHVLIGSAVAVPENLVRRAGFTGNLGGYEAAGVIGGIVALCYKVFS